MRLPAWKPNWDVGRTREKLVNHEPKPRRRVGYYADKPIESVVYCFSISATLSWLQTFATITCQPSPEARSRYPSERMRLGTEPDCSRQAWQMTSHPTGNNAVDIQPLLSGSSHGALNLCRTNITFLPTMSTNTPREIVMRINKMITKRKRLWPFVIYSEPCNMYLNTYVENIAH